MKTLTLLLTISFLSLSACGPKDKDPLNERQRLSQDSAKKTPPPPVSDTPVIIDQSVQTQLFSVYSVDNLNFVQGVSQTARFQLHTFFGAQNPVDVNLVMTKGPVGSKFKKVDLGWEFSWTPDSKLIGEFENYKEYDLDLEFELLPSSSRNAKKMIEGMERTTTYRLIVLKDASQPVIENKIEVVDNSRVEFVVALKGGSADDLRIDRLRGPETPTRELIQMDGTHGIVEHPQLAKSLGKDDEGRTRYQYELTFDKERFLAAFFNELQKSSLLQERYKNGEITETEVAFSLEAVNEYNSRKSPAILVVFKIPLPIPEGESIPGDES